MRDRIRFLAGRHGPLTYAEVVTEALYGEHGFYATNGGAGRARDFLTSPETGHLFGAVVARFADTWWERLGRPDPFWFIEAGAGTGTLCRTVLDAEPACAGALRYVCVEASAALRAQIRAAVPVEPATEILGPVVGTGDEARPAPGKGPLVTVMAGLPPAVDEGVVFANELLDNLPVRVLERGRDDGPPAAWLEVRLDGSLAEHLVPAGPDLARLATRYAPAAPRGTRIPLAAEANRWLSNARATVGTGVVTCLDYGATTAELARRGWPEWVRTYRAHRRGGGPLEHLGLVDITFDVPTDQLRPDRDQSQAEWLEEHGMEDLVAEARRAWDARTGWNLAALKARSRVSEGVSLRDPTGFGGFRALTWRVGPSAE